MAPLSRVSPMGGKSVSNMSLTLSFSQPPATRQQSPAAGAPPPLPLQPWQAAPLLLPLLSPSPLSLPTRGRRISYLCHPDPPPPPSPPPSPLILAPPPPWSPRLLLGPRARARRARERTRLRCHLLSACEQRT